MATPSLCHAYASTAGAYANIALSRTAYAGLRRSSFELNAPTRPTREAFFPALKQRVRVRVRVRGGVELKDWVRVRGVLANRS